MSNSTPIFSNPAVLSALAKHWHNRNDEPPITHAATGRYLSPGQFMAFLLAARGDPYRGCGALLTFSLLTGIPADDLRNACWVDVDTEGGTLVAFSEVSQHFICHTLTKPACTFLDRWEQESANHTGLLFELYGQYIKMDELTDTLLVLGSLAGIVKLSFDDLVRSYDYIALVEALRTDGPAAVVYALPAPQARADHGDQPALPSPAATLAYC